MPSDSVISDKIAFLKQVALFSQLSNDELNMLLPDIQPKIYRSADIIFHQGDSSREFYIIYQGKVRIFKVSPAGYETSINIFGPADVIGEFAAVDQLPRSATAKAITECVLLLISSDLFLERMFHLPNLALGLARLLTAKVRWTAKYAETIAQYDATGRLLHILLLYNEQFGKPIGENRSELDLGLNQTDLASLVGARREWINRLLANWRKQGLIEYQDGKIIFLDLPRVEAERDTRIEANRPETVW